MSNKEEINEDNSKTFNLFKKWWCWVLIFLILLAMFFGNVISHM